MMYIVNNIIFTVQNSFEAPSPKNPSAFVLPLDSYQNNNIKKSSAFSYY